MASPIPDESEEVTDPAESSESVDELSPHQLGRLARINGNFFQLYGQMNQIQGNLDAIAGNKINFQGDLIEILANEHTLRSFGEHLIEAEKYYSEQAQSKTGRDAEIDQEISRLLGQLSDKVGQAADKERDQSDLKVEQMVAESKIYKLEDQKGDLKANEALLELDQGEIEEDQIKIENSAQPILHRIFELEEERSKLHQDSTVSVDADATSTTAPGDL